MIEIALVSSPTLSLAQLAKNLESYINPNIKLLLYSSFDHFIESVHEKGNQLLVLLSSEYVSIRDDGVSVFSEIQLYRPLTAIVVVSNEGDVETVGKAISQGATDFLVLGANIENRIKTLFNKLKVFFDVVRDNKKLKDANMALLKSIQARYQIIGNSPQIMKALDICQKVALIPRPILIVGERGSGKELIARVIHSLGNNENPIVIINCGAFADSLLESELFGHEKGAFTGANVVKLGKFEQADGGTLFLDEIGNMSKQFQQKILRVIEYGCFSRVGGLEEIKVNVRIIAATNVNLLKKIEDGEFLADLYDRLSFETIHVPSLRDRDGDIEFLANHFLNQFEREIPTFQGKSLSKEVVQALKKYSFPGNIRELKNIIERAAYRETSSLITMKDIDLLPTDITHIEDLPFTEQLSHYAKHLLEKALQKNNFNQAAAARTLGLTYDQFRHYLKKHDL
jgi:DNA-binding NtrC family response regulator